MRTGIMAAVLALPAALFGAGVAVQDSRAVASDALAEMVETERAFVQTAQQKGWKQAFLEYFVDGIRGLAGEDTKAELRALPDPPKNLEFWWEPRYGDIAASGELGWLTGPVRRRLPQRDGDKPRYGNYVSVWRRQPDGTFKVVADVGIDIPEPAPFPPGFTRVPMTSRYAGPESADLARDSLMRADRTLTMAARSNVAGAYASAVAPFARLHRTTHMPFEGAESIGVWLQTQPVWSAGETQSADVARSADFGYTTGSYAFGASGTRPAESGHYLRVWSRDAAGRWWLVADVAQRREKQ